MYAHFFCKYVVSRVAHVFIITGLGKLKNFQLSFWLSFSFKLWMRCFEDFLALLTPFLLLPSFYYRESVWLKKILLFFLHRLPVVKKIAQTMGTSTLFSSLISHPLITIGGSICLFVCLSVSTSCKTWNVGWVKPRSMIRIKSIFFKFFFFFWSSYYSRKLCLYPLFALSSHFILIYNPSWGIFWTRVHLKWNLVETRPIAVD